jgi:hypothetical protein
VRPAHLKEVRRWVRKIGTASATRHAHILALKLIQIVARDKEQLGFLGVIAVPILAGAAWNFVSCHHQARRGQFFRLKKN